MRELRQNEFKTMATIQNILTGYIPDFRSRVSVDQIERMAHRLTISSNPVELIAKAMETIAGRSDEKFPTALQIQNEISARVSTEKGDYKPDPQAELDRKNYKKNRQKLEEAVGKKGVFEYINLWRKKFFGDDLTAELFRDFAGNSSFDRLAIADLIRAQGSIKAALRLIEIDKQRI